MRLGGNVAGRYAGGRAVRGGAGGRFLRREHVQLRPRRVRRPRWCIWWRGCGWVGFTLLDTQFVTAHLAQFGAEEIPRELYKQQLAAAVDEPAIWLTDPGPEALEAEFRRLAGARLGSGRRCRVRAAGTGGGPAGVRRRRPDRAPPRAEQHQARRPHPPAGMSAVASGWRPASAARSRGAGSIAKRSGLACFRAAARRNSACRLTRAPRPSSSSVRSRAAVAERPVATALVIPHDRETIQHNDAAFDTKAGGLRPVQAIVFAIKSEAG